MCCLCVVLVCVSCVPSWNRQLPGGSKFSIPIKNKHIQTFLNTEPNKCSLCEEFNRVSCCKRRLPSAAVHMNSVHKSLSTFTFYKKRNTIQFPKPPPPPPTIQWSVQNLSTDNEHSDTVTVCLNQLLCCSTANAGCPEAAAAAPKSKQQSLSSYNCQNLSYTSQVPQPTCFWNPTDMHGSWGT